MLSARVNSEHFAPMAATMRCMIRSDDRIAWLRRLAWLCAVLVLAVTSLSAFIRLSKAGLGCSPWPQCYMQNLGPGDQGLSPLVGEAVARARVAHRILAVATLLLVIAMLMTTVTQGAMTQRRQGRLVFALLMLALFLAVLGRWTPNARVPAVTLANLLAGFAMFAISWRLAVSTGQTNATTLVQRRLVRWAWLGTALLIAQIALGGLVATGRFGLSCPQLWACDLTQAGWEAFIPWREPGFDAAQPGNPTGALLHVVHRLGSLVLAGVLLPLAVAAWRGGRRATGLALLVLLLVQGALGVALVAAGLPLAIALAHNVAAALLLAVVVSLTDNGRPLP